MSRVRGAGAAQASLTVAVECSRLGRLASRAGGAGGPEAAVPRGAAGGIAEAGGQTRRGWRADAPSHAGKGGASGPAATTGAADRSGSRNGSRNGGRPLAGEERVGRALRDPRACRAPRSRNSVRGRGGEGGRLGQWSRTFLARGTGFVEKNFSTDAGGGVWVGGERFRR